MKVDICNILNDPTGVYSHLEWERGYWKRVVRHAKRGNVYRSLFIEDSAKEILIVTDILTDFKPYFFESTVDEDLSPLLRIATNCDSHWRVAYTTYVHWIDKRISLVWESRWLQLLCVKDLCRIISFVSCTMWPFAVFESLHPDLWRRRGWREGFAAKTNNILGETQFVNLSTPQRIFPLSD